MNKEQMELEKLELELRLLKKPWFLKPSIVVSVLSLLFAIYQFINAERKIRIAEKQEQIATKSIEENEKTASFLKARQTKFNEATRPQQLNKSVPSNGPQYIMDVWAYGVDESLVQKTRSYLIEQGHHVGFGGLLSQRPTWLTLGSTVLYYDKSSKVFAQKLANELEKITNIKFTIQRGAGLGVDDDEKDVTFFIHLVK